jgi:hypothetical protein
MGRVEHLALRERRSPAARLGGVIVVVLILGLVAAGALRVLLHQWPWQVGPDRVHVCGRDFDGPGYRYRLDQVTRGGNVPVGVARSLHGDLPVWGRRKTVFGVPGCGTTVYVQLGSDDLRGYALSGGL